MRQPATCNTRVTVPFRQTYLPDWDVFCELKVSVRQVGITKITNYRSIKGCETQNTLVGLSLHSLRLYVHVQVVHRNVERYDEIFLRS